MFFQGNRLILFLVHRNYTMSCMLWTDLNKIIGGSNRKKRIQMQFKEVRFIYSYFQDFLSFLKMATVILCTNKWDRMNQSRAHHGYTGKNEFARSPFANLGLPPQAYLPLSLPMMVHKNCPKPVANFLNFLCLLCLSPWRILKFTPM